MKINVVINKDILEDTITIETNEINDDIKELINILGKYNSYNKIIGIQDNKKYVLDFQKIVRFYSNQKKVYLTYFDNTEYIVKYFLYEIEKMLVGTKFIRISNSEIINIEYLESLETSFSGSIKLTTSTGVITYVSRKYLKNFKDVLKI